MNLLRRSQRAIEVTILDGAALSDPIDFRDLSMMAVLVPSGFANDIGFQHCDTVDGTYAIVYDPEGTLLEITPTAAGWHIAPVFLAPLNFIRLWSQNAGVAANVASDTVFIVLSKS